MTIVITDETALAFWRKQRCTLSRLYDTKPSRIDRVPEKVSKVADIVSACSGFTEPGEQLHVLVPGKSGFRHSDTVCFHSASGTLPFQSLRKVDDGLYVTCPEFTFVRMALKKSVVEHIYIGLEMAGSFVCNSHDMRGFSSCEPLLDPRDLARFIERASGMKGVVRARSNALHVIGKAASPMEAELAMILCLPKRMGGYGLPKPRLNYPIPFGRNQGSKLTRKSITVDVAWPQHRLAMEYDSDQFHTGAEKITADSERRNDIEFLGWDVRTITRKEISSAASMDKIVRSVMTPLGLRKRGMPDGFMTKQADLRRTLHRIRQSG